MSDNADWLFVFATITPKTDFIDDALEALQGLVPKTLAEPGCHMFSVFKNNSDPGRLHLFEAFDDEDALARHYEQDYTRRVFEQYQEWLAEPVDVTKLHAAGHVTQAQFTR